jgi:CubicO group peptidase (beta-lactamase class C family)
MRILLALCLLSTAVGYGYITPAGVLAEKQVQPDPESAGFVPGKLRQIDGVVEASIQAGELPGAVVLVGRRGKTAFFRAFGNRSVKPVQEPMTTDTIFDVASLTKVIVTAPAVMILVEEGVLRLDDRVKRYLPKFTGGGKDVITLRHLLTHYSGLPADFDLSREWSGYPEALEEIWRLKTNGEPGKAFLYSDLNYVVLGEILHTVSGKMPDVFARERIFSLLGMIDTGYGPPQSLVPRIAPTETRRNTLKYLKGQASSESLDKILRGEVHDPTAWRMGGVAGHAGLFSSARDLAIFARMMLDQGGYAKGRLLSPMSVRAMTSPQSPPDSGEVRGFGWDLDSIYSSPRGDLFKGGFGHTGFTGTSLWIHPPTDTFVIILSNRVHPDGGKDINHLRAAVANIVAAAIADPQ